MSLRFADQNPENAPAIIQSAGIAVKKTATRPPRVFAALQLRYRPVTKTGAGDWSTPVTFTVK